MKFPGCSYHSSNQIADPGFRVSCHDCLVVTVSALNSRVDELEAKIIELQSQQNECP